MFDREFESSLSAKKEYLRPIYVVGNMVRITDKLVEFCTKQEFIEITRNDVYHEINTYYHPFQLTFMLVNDDRGTIRISILATTNKLGGGCKKLIRYLNNELKKYFEINQ